MYDDTTVTRVTGSVLALAAAEVPLEDAMAELVLATGQDRGLLRAAAGRVSRGALAAPDVRERALRLLAAAGHPAAGRFAPTRRAS